MDGVLTSLASLVKEGVFGQVEFVEATFKTAGSDVGAQFASTLVFLDLTVRSKYREKLIPLVIKVQCDRTGNDVQFYNELFMYQTVIPTLGFNQDFYPKLFYGKVGEKSPQENMLVFEDLRSKKFVNSKEPLFLDFEHISIAMKRIAMLHSLSFTLKYRDIKKFSKLTGMFKKQEEQETDFEKELFVAIERGIRAYQERNGNDKIFKDFLKATEDPLKVWTALVSPEEPFNVIGHGDFCNNNVMYKYDENGFPIDCALVDFQKAEHVSIGSELAFYLYMHTTNEMREKHWDEFLTIYWETVKENVPEYIEIPSFEKFLDHFAHRAVFGYIVTSFFIPFMMAPNDLTQEGTLEDKLESYRKMGGKEADEKLIDIVSHIYHKKYIHAFLDLKKAKFN